MAGPTTETKATLSFKKLVGKAHTSNSTPFYSESIPSQISIDSSEVLGREIPSDPQQAVNDGLAEYVELDLQAIAASNGLAYNIRFPSDYSGAFGTGVQGELVRTHTQIVDQKNNRQDGFAEPGHTGGYVYDLEDGNGTQIPEGAAENWQLDPVGGIIVSEQEIIELQNNGGTVGAYIYTGDTLSEAIGSIEGGNLAVEDDGSGTVSDVKTLDFGNVLDVSGSGPSVTIDVNDDLSNYDFSNVTTNDLSEPSSPTDSDNLYFTDERAQDAVGNIISGTNGADVTYNDANNTITIDTQGAASDVAEDGTDVVTQATTINFAKDLGVTDDGNGQATIDLDSQVDITGTDSENFTIDADGSNPLSLVNNGSGEMQVTDGSGNFRDFRVRDLIVEGTETILDTETVSIADNTIVLNSDVSNTTSPTEDGGVEINRGSETDATIIYDESEDVWKAGLAGSENEILLAGQNTTDDLDEGNTNLYFTDERAQDAVYKNVLSGDQTRITVTYDDTNNEVDYVVDDDISNFDLSNVSTDDISEGSTNQYFTDERAQDAVGAILSSQFTYTDNDQGSDEIAINQGDGSGLNADQLDGLDQSAFARLAQDETITGNYTFEGAVDVASSGSLDLSGNEITGVADPTAPQAAATKNYVDVEFDQRDNKESVRAATIDGQNIDLTSTGGGTPITLDNNKSINDGERVLLKNQTDLTENGIYVAVDATDPSTWVRAEDADDAGDVSDGTTVFVRTGQVNGNREFVQFRKDPITPGTDEMEFEFATGLFVKNDDGTGASFLTDGVDDVTFGPNLNPTANDVRQLTLEVEKDLTEFDFTNVETDDINEGTNNLYYTDERVKNTLSAGGDITYSKNIGGSAAEFALDVSELSASDLFGSKTTDDLPEGSNQYFTDERAQDAVGTITSGTNGISVTYDDNADTLTIDGGGAASNVSDDGNTVVTRATDLNFGRGLTAVDDGDNTATITSNLEMESATFSGDGIQKEFQIAHGLSLAPKAWTIHATTDAASGISHSKADGTNITLIYDTAPPSGTDNIKVNYLYERQ